LVHRIAGVDGGYAWNDQSRMARLQLTTIRVAVIGLAGAVVTAVGVPLCLLFLPGPLGLWLD